MRYLVSVWLASERRDVLVEVLNCFDKADACLMAYSRVYNITLNPDEDMVNYSKAITSTNILGSWPMKHDLLHMTVDATVEYDKK